MIETSLPKKEMAPATPIHCTAGATSISNQPDTAAFAAAL
jgi:hypothetical protein